MKRQERLREIKALLFRGSEERMSCSSASSRSSSPEIRQEYPQLRSQDQDGYKSPKKYNKLTTIFKVQNQQSTSTPTQNRYSPLPIEKSIIGKDGPSQARANKRQRPNTPPTSTPPSPKSPPTEQKVAIPKETRPMRPPPFVVKSVPQSHTLFISELKQTLKSPFTIKYSIDSSTVLTTTNDDHRQLRDLKNNNQKEFHTFARRDEKTSAYVLRGLDGEPELETIMEDLTNKHNLPVETIYKMKTKTRKPMFMVLFKGSISIT